MLVFQIEISIEGNEMEQQNLLQLTNNLILNFGFVHSMQAYYETRHTMYIQPTIQLLPFPCGSEALDDKLGGNRIELYFSGWEGIALWACR
jgi:hypothetical protein